uniref:Uncharacterized protein n=1 Tax=viral metagenome TaxID=1070528 RepID=A0A6M3JPT9_9ZZZZ
MLEKITKFGDLKRLINSIKLADDAEVVFRDESGYFSDITFAFEGLLDIHGEEMIDYSDLNTYAKENSLDKEDMAEIKPALVLGYMDQKSLDEWVESEL